MLINSIYYSFLPPSYPLPILSPKPGFVFWTPNGRRCIYFQPSSSQPTAFFVSNLHTETKTEKKKSHCNNAWIPRRGKLQEPGETMGLWKARLTTLFGCRKALLLNKSKWGNLKTEVRKNQIQSIYVCSTVLKFKFRCF